MERHKYSVPANPNVITFLVNNGIYFVFCKGFQSRRHRLFFIATEEDVKTLTKFTGWHVNDEEGGWDFNGWDAIEKN